MNQPESEAMRGDSPEEHGSSYVRLPMPAVAAVLLVLIAALLTFGVWANRNLRGQAAAVPVPVAAVTPAISTAVVVAAPTPLPTSIAASGPTATAQPTAVLPVATATAAPATEPPATPQPTALPTVEPNVAAEVGQAYENFWRVRSQAELTLDGSRAGDVMNGEYLAHFLDVLNQMQQQGRAIKTQVSLDYTVVQANDNSALLHDRIEDTSYYIDAATGTPLSDPAHDVVLIEFTLVKTDGAWKVVDSVTET